jgi:hypothetical protein
VNVQRRSTIVVDVKDGSIPAREEVVEEDSESSRTSSGSKIMANLYGNATAGVDE